MPTSPVPNQTKQETTFQQFDNMTTKHDDDEKDNHQIKTRLKDRCAHDLKLDTKLANTCNGECEQMIQTENNSNERDCEAQKRSERKHKKRRLLSLLQMVALILVIIVILIGVVIGTVYVYTLLTKTNESSTGTDAGHTTSTPEITTKYMEPAVTKQSKTKKAKVLSGQQNAGVEAYLSDNFLEGDGNILKFTVNNSIGIDADSIRYRNGEFHVMVSGYYFIHVVVSIRAIDINETIRFHGCLNIRNETPVCRRSQEQPKWVGTMDIILSHRYLTRGQRLYVTFSNKAIIYHSYYDTTFKMWLL